MFAHVIAAEDEDPLFTIYGPGTFNRAPFRAPELAKTAISRGLVPLAPVSPLADYPDAARPLVLELVA